MAVPVMVLVPPTTAATFKPQAALAGASMARPVIAAALSATTAAGFEPQAATATASSGGPQAAMARASLASATAPLARASKAKEDNMTFMPLGRARIMAQLLRFAGKGISSR